MYLWALKNYIRIFFYRYGECFRGQGDLAFMGVGFRFFFVFLSSVDFSTVKRLP